MTVLGLIPARGGSKGIPRKNLALLNGKPLIVYSIEAALNSKTITEIVVSTDDPEIASVCESCGIAVPRLRSPQFATDAAGLFEVTEEVLAWRREDGLQEPDLIVLLQPTSPLRSAADIDGTVAALRASGSESAVSVHAMAEHPAVCICSEHDGWRFLVPPGDAVRRQDYPGRYLFINGAVYAVTPRFLAQHRRFMIQGQSTTVFEMDRARGVDIDDSCDLVVASALMAASFQNESGSSYCGG